MNEVNMELLERAKSVLKKKELAVLTYKFENPIQRKNRLEIAQHFCITPYRIGQIEISIDRKLVALD